MKRALICSLLCCLVCSRSKSGIVNHGITGKQRDNPKSLNSPTTDNEYPVVTKSTRPDQLDIEKWDRSITVLKQGLGAVGQY